MTESPSPFPSREGRGEEGHRADESCPFTVRKGRGFADIEYTSVIASPLLREGTSKETD